MEFNEHARSLTSAAGKDPFAIKEYIAMKIIHCKLNHLTNPLGWDVEHPTISYVVTEAKGCFQRAARAVHLAHPD